MGQLSEFQLIERFFAPLKCSAIPCPMGDDAAVISTGSQTAICTDTLVEGTHFLADWPLDAVAWKAVAVNVSDLLAMGARPEGWLLALTLPQADTAALKALQSGFSQAQKRFGLCLLGGDTTHGEVMTLTVTALGRPVVRSGWRRNAARPGDVVVVTGTLGDAALGLKCLLDRGAVSAMESDPVRALLRPALPLQAWERLIHMEVHAAIDLSDGLVQDAGHVADQSGVSIEIDLDALPLSPAVEDWCKNHDDWSLPLTGGEDYQLLLTMPVDEARRAEKEGWVRPVGRVSTGCGVRLSGVRLSQGGRSFSFEGQSGYRHF